MIILEGEVRKVGIEVISNLNQDFVIDAADYAIYDSTDAEIETGVPTIEGHRVATLFNAATKGTYTVVIKYHIGAEILKANINVEVR